MSKQAASPPCENRMPITSMLNPPLAENSPRMPPRPVLEPPSCWFAPRPPVSTVQSPGYASSREDSPCLSSTSSGSHWGGGVQARPPTADSVSHHRKASGKRSIDGMELDDVYDGHMESQYAPPTPPGEDFAPSPSYPYHTTPSAARPCTCASCKSTRYAAHADAHSRYSADMALLMTEKGRFAIGSSAISAERFAAYFASLTPVEEPSVSTPTEAYVSGSSKPPSIQSKKDAHKIKEKSRRDTVKSFMLSFSSMVPAALGPCTPHRFSKNNVEEPANVTVLDRAALYLTAQRLAFEGLVRDGRLSGDEVEARILHVLPEAGAFVQKALGRSEAYVGELRWHGIQNPSFEPETKGKKSGGGGTKRRRFD